MVWGQLHGKGNLTISSIQANVDNQIPLSSSVA